MPDPIGPQMKRCTKCGVVKPASEFHRHTAKPDGLFTWCKPCTSARGKVWREANKDKHQANVRAWQKANPERKREYDRAYYAKHPEKFAEYSQRHREKHPELSKARRRNGELRRRFGIGSAEYEAMLVKQKGGCALCGAPPDEGKNLCVDHCHQSGAVRALLCQRCNKALGFGNDDPKWFDRAARYLRRHAPPK